VNERDARGPRGEWGLRLGVVIAAVAAAAFGWLLLSAQALPTTVVEIAWDKAACAHCRMHVGEKAFASQLQLVDGRVLDFDDPGCLLSWLDQNADEVHAVYIHHHTEDRWLTRANTAFAEVSPTPMGFGLGAVDAATPGAITWDQAAARISSRKGSLR